MSSLLITGGTIISSDGEQRADVRIENGVVVKIGVGLQGADETIDASGKLLLPGLIDCHVHFREPGYEYKSTMASEAVSALAGGVTTVCEMPNTNPPTCTIEGLKRKVEIAKNLPSHFQIKFFYGITQAEHLEELRELWTNDQHADLRKWVCGVKLYFDHSTGDQGIDQGILDQVFAACSSLKIPIAAHCEDPQLNAEAMSGLDSFDHVSKHSLSRPPESEAKAIAQALELTRKHGAQFHVAHLSTRDGLELVRQAKSEGLKVTCEVAPHHLFLSVEDYDRLGGYGKMNPPLRTPDHCEALWTGIEEGTVDCIATDHAPHTRNEKQEEDPAKIPCGVPGVETMLPLMLTRLTPSDILRLCHTNPNRIYSLNKSEIRENVHADIIILDPSKEVSISSSTLHSAVGWIPYEGMSGKGEIRVVT